MNGDGVVISTSINDDLSEAIVARFLIELTSITISYFDIVIPIAASLDVSPLQRIHNFEQICAIEQDPHFAGETITMGPRQSGACL